MWDRSNNTEDRNQNKKKEPRIGEKVGRPKVDFIRVLSLAMKCSLITGRKEEGRGDCPLRAKGKTNEKKG